MLRALVAGVTMAICGPAAVVVGLVHRDWVEVLIGLGMCVLGWAFLMAFRAGKARGDGW